MAIMPAMPKNANTLPVGPPETSGTFLAAPPAMTPHQSCPSARDSPAELILRHWREAVPNDRFAHLVKDATRSFQRSLQMRLARFDVPFGHWTFLRALWERDGLTQKQLSDEVGVMEPTTLMAVRAMEARGWVQRRQRADNRKNVHVYLTDAGRALKDVLVPLAEEVNATGARGLTAEEIAVARRVLLTMITNLAEDATGRE